MKDGYNFPRGTYPEELFEKIENIEDLHAVSRVLSVIAPCDMWEYARRGFLDAVFEYIYLYVPEEHRNMEMVKELIQMEYDEKLEGFFSRIAAAGPVMPQLCNRYDLYRIQPEEVREAILTEVVYSLGLNKEMNTRRCTVLVNP